MRTRRPESSPRPRRDPQAETQQGPYATAPSRGLEKGPGRLGRPARTEVPERRPRGPPPLPPAAQSGRASSAAAAPFLLLSGGHGPTRVSRGSTVSAGNGGRRARPVVRPTPRAARRGAEPGEAQAAAGGRRAGTRGEAPVASALVLLLL